MIALLARGQRDKELAEEQQEQAEERFRALVQHTSDAILIIEDGGAVRYASPAVEHLFGCPPEELKCLDITWVDADHAEAIEELFRSAPSPARARSRSPRCRSAGSTDRRRGSRSTSPT